MGKSTNTQLIVVGRGYLLRTNPPTFDAEKLPLLIGIWSRARLDPPNFPSFDAHLQAANSVMTLGITTYKRICHTLKIDCENCKKAYERSGASQIAFSGFHLYFIVDYLVNWLNCRVTELVAGGLFVNPQTQKIVRELLWVRSNPLERYFVSLKSSLPLQSDFIEQSKFQYANFDLLSQKCRMSLQCAVSTAFSVPRKYSWLSSPVRFSLQWFRTSKTLLGGG